MSLLWLRPYEQRVRALLPIAYWMQAETAGTTVLDASGNGRTGTYTAASLVAPGIGDGLTGVAYDGSTSRANVFGASLAAAFSTSAGTLLAWARVASESVWSDTTNRYVFELNADASNRVSILRSTTNNTMTLAYRGGNVLKQVSVAALSGTDWYFYALTWSIAGDAVRAYLNGAQTGTTQTTVTEFTGAPAVAMVGAQTAAPAAVWSGSIAHVALFNRALTAAEIAGLA